ncbi:MAG: alpha/beta fold hydrolase [Sphingobium sp.]
MAEHSKHQDVAVSDFLGPTSHSFISQRTRLHYVDWGNPDAPTLLLVHGGRDHARSWDWVAARLRANYHVVAHDLRGHGDSDWSSDGGYSPSSHVFDLARLVDHLEIDQAAVVAHSLGASVALRHAALFPDRVSRLVSVEGTGPLPPEMVALQALPLAQQLRGWIERRHAVAARQASRYATLADAFSRMRAENPDLTDEQIRHLVTHAVRRNEDGTFGWKFDPYIRHAPPIDCSRDELHKLWRQIRCPVLLAWGRRSWNTDPRANGALAQFANARETAFDGGHWLQHDCFEAFMSRITRFLATGD